MYNNQPLKKMRQCPQILGSQAPHRRCVPPGRRSGSQLSLGLARPPEGGSCQGTRFFQGGLELFHPKNGGKKWGGEWKKPNHWLKRFWYNFFEGFPDNDSSIVWVKHVQTALLRGCEKVVLLWPSKWRMGGAHFTSLGHFPLNQWLLGERVLGIIFPEFFGEKSLK